MVLPAGTLTAFTVAIHKVLVHKRVSRESRRLRTHAELLFTSASRNQRGATRDVEGFAQDFELESPFRLQVYERNIQPTDYTLVYESPRFILPSTAGIYTVSTLVYFRIFRTALKAEVTPTMTRSSDGITASARDHSIVQTLIMDLLYEDCC